MSGSGAALLVAAAGLVGVSVGALVHRRDALGAIGAVLMLLTAAGCALAAFAATAPTSSDAAQLQAFALIVELLAPSLVVAAVGVALVLRRRSGSDLLSLVTARPGGPAAAARPSPASDPSEPEDEPGSATDGSPAADDDGDASEEPV